MRLMKWVLLFGLISIAGAIGVLWSTAPTPGLTEENAHRLRAGMTLEQVEALFGLKGSEEAYAKGTYVFLDRGELSVSAHFDENGLLWSVWISQSLDTGSVQLWRINLDE